MRLRPLNVVVTVPTAPGWRCALPQHVAVPLSTTIPVTIRPICVRRRIGDLHRRHERRVAGIPCCRWGHAQYAVQQRTLAGTLQRCVCGSRSTTASTRTSLARVHASRRADALPSAGVVRAGDVPLTLALLVHRHAPLLPPLQPAADVSKERLRLTQHHLRHKTPQPHPTPHVSVHTTTTTAQPTLRSNAPQRAAPALVWRTAVPVPTRPGPSRLRRGTATPPHSR